MNGRNPQREENDDTHLHDKADEAERYRKWAELMDTGPALRVRVAYDEEGSQNQESPEGTPLPETEEQYLKNTVRRLIDPTDDPATGKRRELSYAEYCAYEGNPDRHVILEFSIERQCPCCESWTPTDQALHGVDFMDDDPWLMRVDYAPPGSTYTEAEAASWKSYGSEVSRELFEEARSDGANHD